MIFAFSILRFVKKNNPNLLFLGEAVCAELEKPAQLRSVDYAGFVIRKGGLALDFRENSLCQMCGIQFVIVKQGRDCAAASELVVHTDAGQADRGFVGQGFQDGRLLVLVA